MKKYKLFIDETGREHPSHLSQQYVLLGCIIASEKQTQLEVRADRIKYRYWKKTNIVFHSKEIARNHNEFAIFTGKPALKKEFQGDILDFLNAALVRIACAIVDKATVFGYAVPWKPETIIAKTTDSLAYDFLDHIYAKKSSGAVIFEASGYAKDTLYLRSFNKFLTPGWEMKHPEFKNIRQHLTSISFATKLNHDIECEIADLLSYAALCKYKIDMLGTVYTKGSYEQKLVDVLNKKLLTRLKKGPKTTVTEQCFRVLK